MTFKSKISFGLLVFISLSFFAPMVLVYYDEGPTQEWMLTMGFLVALWIFILYLFNSTIYRIENGIIVTKVGPFRYPNIPINSIYEISRSRSFLAAPAASLDRLEIKYGKYQSLLVSPQDKKAFIEALRAINPTIELSL